MKTLITLFFVLTTLSLSAQDWERVNGPYAYQYGYNLFEQNNQLCVSSSSWENINLKLENGEWKKIENGILSEIGLIYNQFQNENVIVLSSKREMIRSYDYGETWEVVKPLEGTFVFNSLTIVDETIFVQIHFLNSSLYKLEKESTQWEKVFLSGGSQDSIYADKLYSKGDYIFAVDIDAYGFHKTGGGITMSSDKGKTWRKLSNFNLITKSIILHNEILFVAGIDMYLYISKDYGETWEVDTNKKMPVDLFYSDGNKLYTAVNSIGAQHGVDFGLHFSTDNGETWERRHEGIGTNNIRKLLSYENVLYCLNDTKNVVESSDYGQTWVKSKILTDSINSYEFYNINDTLLVATSSRLGLHFINAEVNDWEVFGNGFSQIPYKIYNRDSIFVCIILGGKTLNISTDYGKNWKNVYVGLFVDLDFIKDVELLGGDTLLLATILGTRFSTDYGVSWNKFHNEILDSNFDTRNILRLDDNTLIIVARNEGLFKSTDNGQNWVRIPTEFLTVQSTQFEIFEYNNGRIYAFLPAHGLFYSEDEGVTWKEFNKDFSEKGSDRGIAFYGDYVIISSKDGILVSNDDGKSAVYHEIEKFASDDSSDSKVADIAIHNDFIFVASGIGIYKIKLYDLGIEAITSVESEIERNYFYALPPFPQPTSSIVTTEVYLDQGISLSKDGIKVFDMNGTQVEKGDNIEVSGTNWPTTLKWDSSNQPPGVYFIVIDYGENTRAIKVIKE